MGDATPSATTLGESLCQDDFLQTLKYCILIRLFPLDLNMMHNIKKYIYIIVANYIKLYMVVVNYIKLYMVVLYN